MSSSVSRQSLTGRFLVNVALVRWYRGMSSSKTSLPMPIHLLVEVVERTGMGNDVRKDDSDAHAETSRPMNCSLAVDAVRILHRDPHPWRTRTAHFFGPSRAP